MDMFKFISNCIDLRKMNNSSAQNLVDHINYLLNDENDRKLINYAPAFLYVLRSQDNVLTEGMDKLVFKYFPNYYNGTYKLATIENNNRDLNIIVKNYIANIKNNNQTQGENGAYFGHKQSEIAILRYMLLREDFSCNIQMMDSLISALSDTLIISKENISIKLDAISLLICIAVKYPEDYKRNQNIYEKIFWQEENIDVFEDDLIFSNIDSISLKIGLQFLFASIGKDVYCKVLELMPCIQGDIATTFSVTQLIVEYLENSETIMLPYKVEGIILQNVLQWLHSENANIRFNAMRILLMLSRNSENHGFVNNQLVNLVDSSDAHIKRYIVQNIYTTCGITKKTRKYIVSKCKYDTNFIVRMACEEAENDNTNNE